MSSGALKAIEAGMKIVHTTSKNGFRDQLLDEVETDNVKKFYVVFMAVVKSGNDARKEMKNPKRFEQSHAGVTLERAEEFLEIIKDVAAMKGIRLSDCPEMY